MKIIVYFFIDFKYRDFLIIVCEKLNKRRYNLIENVKYNFLKEFLKFLK